MLSRVDGISDLEDIAMMCGMDALQVMSIVQRLVQLGAVSMGNTDRPAPKPPEQAKPQRITISPPSAPIREQNATRRSVPPPRMPPAARVPVVPTAPSVPRGIREITPVVEQPVRANTPLARENTPPVRGDTPFVRADTPPVRSETPFVRGATSQVERPVRGATPRVDVERPARTTSQPKVVSEPAFPSSPTPPPVDMDSQRPTLLPPVSDPSQLYTSEELDEDVEIPMDRRKAILAAYHRTDDMTHYAVLGLEQDADKADVKRAYFALSKQFHPDSLFGRRLGAYKHKMEVVFKRLTEAYDVLSKKKRRQEYDEYLAATAETRRAQDIIARSDREAAVIEQTIRASMQAMPAVDPTAKPASSNPPPTSGRVGGLPPPPGVTPEEPPRDSLRPPATPGAAPKGSSRDDERRRVAQQVLRRRLGAATGRASSLPPAMGSSTPPARTSSLPPDAPADERRKDALRGLARTLRDATVATGGDRVATSVKRAQEAESAGDLVGASNFYRLAMAGAPERKDLQQAHERVSSALSGQLADSYEKQAQYEERSGRWPEASRAWVKVCEGRPKDARALKSAAASLLRANGDLHTALRYAKMHVELAGENAGNLTLLARVYLGAGLKLNARRELEKAAKLDPSDEMIKNLLKEAR